MSSAMGLFLSEATARAGTQDAECLQGLQVGGRQRTAGTALQLSDTSSFEVVREWGVRRMGERLELRTRAGLVKSVVVDLFPAYDDDGGLLVALSSRS